MTGLDRMRTGVKAFALAVAGFATCSSTTAGQQSTDRFDAAEFDAYVARAVSEWEVPGLAVAVVKDGELLFERGYGVLALGQEGAVDEHTLFAIGSTTKALTAAAIAMLSDDGKLSLDDRVTDHLPWFQLKDAYVTRELRVRDLLTHNAGLGNADFLWYEQDRSTREVVRALRWVDPAYSFRSGFIYQNLMYATAGEVIAAVSGMSWEDFIESRILAPLGMDRTVTTLEATKVVDNVGQPHYRIDGTVVRIENASVDPVAAAGSIWSSVHDMSKWMRFLLAGGVTVQGDRLLSEEAFAELFEPHSFVGLDSFYPTARLTKPRWRTYGLGWFQADYEGRAVDFHTGSIDGMVAIAGLIRREGIGVYVLANRDHAEVRHALMYRVFDLFDAEDPQDWSADLQVLYGELEAAGAESQRQALESRVPDTKPSLPAHDYVGEFADPLYGDVRIVTDGDALRLHYGRQEGRLDHWNYDTFRVTWDARWRGSSLVNFELSSTGSVSGMSLGGAEFSRKP